MSGKKTICLNMIVKNEAHIIADTLEHLLKYIWFDYWVISDTGSTDDTKEVIKDFFKAKGIPGELQEEPWQDFGYNRTKAFEGAYKKADYAFVWDADDEIYGDFKMPDILNADSYKFTFGNAEGMRYSRPQLFNMNKRWCYKGVLHEYANCLEEVGPSVDVAGNYYFISGRRGDRSKDPNKYLKDALVLEKASEKALAEGDPLYNRYIFYCAQSYNSSNNHEKAIEFYRKALTLPLWIQEKYVACMEVYDQYELLKKPEEGLRYLVESYKHDPTRIECYYRLIKYYCINGPVEVAYAYYTVIQDFYENHYNPNTLGEKLFARRSEYDFYLPYYMVIVSERTKRHDTCAKMYELIFKYRFIAPEWWLKNIFHNIQFCADQLPLSLDFLESMLSYIDLIRRAGVILESKHFLNVSKIIDRYRPLLSDLKPELKIICALTEARFTDKRPTIMLTITTCKRLDLFTKTMNSILSMWADIDKIDYFYCVDDNSSSEDRLIMQKQYPFFHYYMKTPKERGHRESMNLIWQKLDELKPTYWIHLEDDWLYFKNDSYVTRALEVLTKYESKGVHQVVFNKNYGLAFCDLDRVGGLMLDPGTVLHEKREGLVGKNCGYWPHYSLQPSMVRTQVALELGNYDSPNKFFERDYADRYCAKSYMTAFFNSIYSIHIGKQHWEKEGMNAYALNEVPQFNNCIYQGNDIISVANVDTYNPIRYLSGGKLGDFIHQLSVIQENYIKTGIKAILYISNTGDHFTLGLETAYNDIKNFILAQPYIYDFKIHNGEQYNINLSDWRYNTLLFHVNWHELFKSQYNVEWGTHPWLHASIMKPEFNETILFHCSLIRFPETINFSKLFETYGMKNIKFITQNPIEYMKFLDMTGIELDEYNPTSLEDFIDTVASCKLFIGCLSSPLTYALGLHKESVILLPNNHSIEITCIKGLEHIFPNVKIMV